MDNRENVRKESKKAVLIIIPAYKNNRSASGKTGTAGDSAGCRFTGRE